METIRYYPILPNFKCVSFSDTHNLHEGVNLPECDIAIFCGDYSGRGNKFETLHFLRWYSRQDQCKYKVMIPGNHDICFDEKHNGETHAQNWLEGFQKKFKNLKRVSLPFYFFLTMLDLKYSNQQCSLYLKWNLLE